MSTNTLLWGLFMMATMNILVLVKRFVFLVTLKVTVTPIRRKDARSHAKSSQFPFLNAGSTEVIGELSIYCV